MSKRGMSERELTKWKNKYKVYKALHPDMRGYDYCESCALKDVECWKEFSLYYDPDEGKVCYGIDKTGCICIEWIKNV